MIGIRIFLFKNWSHHVKVFESGHECLEPKSKLGIDRISPNINADYDGARLPNKC